MKWVAYSENNKFSYEIIYDKNAGFYVYVLEGNSCIRDYLQDTLEIAMECILEDYGVETNAWQKLEK